MNCLLACRGAEIGYDFTVPTVYSGSGPNIQNEKIQFMNEESDFSPRPSAGTISLGEAFWTWCRVAVFSFGGPAGQIAVMHRIIVDEKKWITEERFLHALNYCMLLPGPEAQQLATYIGWLMHRTIGGLMAGILFVMPGFISILALSIGYACFQQTTIVAGLFFGLKPAVMAIVVGAVIRIGNRILKNKLMYVIAGTAFVAIFFFNIPFPLLIALAGLIGLLGGRIAPEQFRVLKEHGATGQTEFAIADKFPLVTIEPTWRRSLKICAIFLPLWFGPLALVGWFTGRDSVFTQEGIFFSQAAVVTFGGAYSVLAYIAQQAVERFGWLQPGEMLDGMGMAETTPGPLIMVVQFVGFMGAYRNPGSLNPLTAGVLGSIVTVWATFVPCFFWIFLGAPFVERLRGNRTITAALSSITAAVVGVILNLAVWFSLHTIFGTVETSSFGGIRLLIPVWSTLSYGSLVICVIAFLLTFYWKRGMFLTLAVCGACGYSWYLSI